MLQYTGYIHEWYSSIYDIADEINKNGLVIFGAGVWGKKTYDIFQLFDAAPNCFCDEDPNKIGMQFCSLPIVSLQEALSDYPNAVYIAAAFNFNKRRSMNKKLKEMGVLSAFSGFQPARYMFLLDTGLEIFDSPANKNDENNFTAKNLNKIIIFNHMMNSGSWYFQQLTDGHSHILNIPAFGTVYHLKDAYINRLSKLKGRELLMELTAQMNRFFYTDDCARAIRPLDIHDFYLNENGQYDKRIEIDPILFIQYLKTEIEGKEHVSYADCLKMFFCAYANTLGRKYNPNISYYIFYEMHMNDYHLDYLEDVLQPGDFNRIEYLFIIREPVSHLYSIVKRYIIDGYYKNHFLNIFALRGTLASDLGKFFEKKPGYDNVRAVCFEDAKEKPKETMQAFCDWLDIPYEEILERTTTNEIDMYFPVKTGGVTRYITGNDPFVLKSRDYSLLMTSFDIFRFNLAFQYFKKACGYLVDIPNARRFSKKSLVELYRLDFLITKTLLQQLDEAGDPYRCREEMRTFIQDYLLQYIFTYNMNTQYYQILGQE